MIARAQEHRAERGGERQRDDSGDDHREHDRHGELLVHLSRDTAHERDRDEHRAEHGDDRDQRTSHLLHRSVGSHARRDFVLRHDALDVLDHHDGVVDDDTDRESQAEEREQIDREAECPEAQKRADDGHGHREQRDQRRTPVLQKDEDDDRDERHRDQQRVDHLVNRRGDEGSRVEPDLVMHACRERLLQLRHPLDVRVAHCERVGARAEVHDDRRDRLPVVHADEAVVARAEAHGAHIGNAQHGAVGARADDDVSEFLRRAQPPHRRDGERELRARWRGLTPDRAGRIGVVLLVHRGVHVGHRDAELRHLLGIELDVHREIQIAERRRVADAGNALDLILEIDLRVVAEELALVTRVRGGEHAHQQNVRLRLLHDDAVAAHRLGKLRSGERHLILHVHCGEILIARDVERHLQAHRAVARARGLIVEKPRNACELLLDRRGDGGRDIERGSARIVRVHLHHRRCHVRIARDRKVRKREQSEQHDDDRDDGREDRTSDEEIANLLGLLSDYFLCARLVQRIGPGGAH